MHINQTIRGVVQCVAKSRAAVTTRFDLCAEKTDSVDSDKVDHRHTLKDYMVPSPLVTSESTSPLLTTHVTVVCTVTVTVRDSDSERNKHARRVIYPVSPYLWM